MKIKKFDDSLNESFSDKDKVVDMYITAEDMDEYTQHKLVVTTQSGKTYNIKATPKGWDEEGEDF